MSRILRLVPPALLAALAVLAAASAARADDRKLFVGFREIPYVFILFDTSSSMAAVTECTPEDLAAGFCSQLCDIDGGGCMAPLNADDPASKLYEAKEILYQVLLETENVDFGFATLNQDDLNVRRKHWLYSATGPGPTLPNSSPVLHYPETGQQDVFGPQWPCTSGGSNIGCFAQNDAADLSDPYEAERMQRFPRGDIDAAGTAFDSKTSFYVAQGARDYKVDYDVPTGAPGDASIAVQVTVCESNNGGNCTGTVSSSTVTYALVDEFLSLDLGPDPSGTQQFEEFEGLEGFFAQADNLDVLADTGTTENGVGQCGGLDMNDDTDEDIYVDPYNLRWPTAAGGACSGSGDSCSVDGDCPGGETCEPAPLLDVGDFVPFDWRDGHKQLILSRLAPNLLLGEATPDFSTSRYFEAPADASGPNGVLDLLDAAARPILPTAKTPLDTAIADFREWYDGCRHEHNSSCEDLGWEEYAETRDPNWSCRKKYLLIFTDGDITCQEGGNACDATSNMNAQVGIETFVIAYGTSSDEQQPGGGNQSTLTCLPANSGAGNGQEIGALFPHNRQELLDALKLIFSAIVGRTATFSAAAVPSVQAEALDKLFLTSLSPVNEHSVWPGRLDAFLKPLPLDAENRPDTTAACPDPSNNASKCHLWDAGTVMLAEQINVGDPVGPTAGQRRVGYPQFPPDASVPQVQESFETSTNRSVAIEVERDFWRGLGIQFTPGDTASEDAARVESDGIVTETLAVKTGTLPPPDETVIDYIMGEIFHSDPAVVGSPTNNLYFIADLGTDGNDATGCDDSDERGYRCFFFRNAKRRKVLGAGSNDGMFHLWDIGSWSTTGDFVDRFDNGTGKEILGYIPRTVMPVVKRTTEDPVQAQYAVDGRPAAADVFIDPVHDGTPVEADREWRTVVLGGLRSGGWTTLQGFSNLEGPVGSEAQKAASYFLLDITQPDPVPLANNPEFVPKVADPPACLTPGEADCGTLAYGTPLWEFTDTIAGVREEGDPDEESDNVIVGVRLDEDGNGLIDLAPTWSTPNFGRMRVCAAGGENCNVADPDSDVEVRHVAIFGGGLDGEDPTNPIFYGRGNFLYILDVETGRTMYKWGLDGAAPSEPAAVDTNFDGFLDTIYVGTNMGFLYRADLEATVGGNVIAPQLEDADVDAIMADGTVVSETQQRITDVLYKPYILFNANDVSVDEVIVGVAGGTLRPQQMYYRPSVIFVPDLDRYALAFGTGNRADLFDRGETAGGRFFVLVDDVAAIDLQSAGFTPLTAADIQQVDLTAPRRTDDLLVSAGGWWFQLAANQRVVTETFALSGVLFFSSFIPADQAIIVEEGPGGSEAANPDAPPPGDDFFCRESGTSQIFATLATNANGLLFVPDVVDPVRFRTVEDLATRPYTELSQTANPIPDEPPPPLTDELLKIQEELKQLFPSNCKFPPGYNIGVKTRVTDTGIEFIAPVPICVIEKNFRDY